MSLIFAQPAEGRFKIAQQYAADLRLVETAAVARLPKLLAKLSAALFKALRTGDDPAQVVAEEILKLRSALARFMVASHLRGFEAERMQFGLQLSQKADVYEDAVKALQWKLGLDDEAIRRLTTQYGAAATKVLSKVSDSANRELTKTMTQIVSEGLHVKDSMEVLENKLAKLGLAPQSPWMLETAVRTQTAMAYGAGRWEADQDPTISDMIWGYEYFTVGDDRVRERHRGYDGMRLPKDDKFWEVGWPPNGYNCRCQAVPILDHGTSKAGKPVDGVDPGVDTGFAFNPAKLGLSHAMSFGPGMEEASKPKYLQKSEADLLKLLKKLGTKYQDPKYAHKLNAIKKKSQKVEQELINAGYPKQDLHDVYSGNMSPNAAYVHQHGAQLLQSTPQPDPWAKKVDPNPDLKKSGKKPAYLLMPEEKMFNKLALLQKKINAGKQVKLANKKHALITNELLSKGYTQAQIDKVKNAYVHYTKKTAKNVYQQNAALVHNAGFKPTENMPSPNTPLYTPSAPTTAAAKKAKPITEALNALAQKHEIQLDPQLGKASKGMQKILTERLESFTTAFPDLATKDLKAIKVADLPKDKPFLMKTTAYGQELQVNSMYLKNTKLLKQELKAAYQNKQTVGKTIAYAIDHELGHAIGASKNVPVSMGTKLWVKNNMPSAWGLSKLGSSDSYEAFAEGWASMKHLPPHKWSSWQKSFAGNLYNDYDKAPDAAKKFFPPQAKAYGQLYSQHQNIKPKDKKMQSTPAYSPPTYTPPGPPAPEVPLKAKPDAEVTHSKELHLKTESTQSQPGSGWHHKINSGERKAIESWTGGGYPAVRRWQIGKVGADYGDNPEMQEHKARAIVGAMRREGVATEGHVYRGFRGMSPEWIDKHETGKKLKLTAMASFSLDPERAEAFASIGSRKDQTFSVVYVVPNNKAGRRIWDVSHYRSESESLVPRGATYKVQKKVFSKWENRYYIYMEDISEPDVWNKDYAIGSKASGEAPATVYEEVSLSRSRHAGTVRK